MYCPNCDDRMEASPNMISCQFCQSEFASGRILFECDHCGKVVSSGKNSNLFFNQQPVCDLCAMQHSRICTLCQSETPIKDVGSIDGAIVCKTCTGKVTMVWCPICMKDFPNKGYLNIAFHDDLASYHAAALVTHYRHRHITSHDKAWKNGQYASKIPGYQYDEYKVKVNNQAKRQLIRSISKAVRAGTYPIHTRVTPVALVAGFRQLKDNDEKTNDLVSETLTKLLS